MPIKPDPNAMAYWTRCPRCFEKHVAKTHHEAIFGITWHKKDCPFITDAIYTTFNAYPIYSLRHRLIRHLPDSIKKTFNIKPHYNTA